MVSVGLVCAVGDVTGAQPAPTPSKPAPQPQRIMQPPPASPRPNVPAVVGATEIAKITTPFGFIDDVVTTDDQRVAYVVADAATKAELHVYSLVTKAELVVDIAAITLQPVEIALVGTRALVIGKLDDGTYHGALVELEAKGKQPAGKVVYKVGAANGLTVITRDGKRRIAAHRFTAAGGATKHQTELLALETGKRVAPGRPLELDAEGKNAKLDFKINHWSDGMTRAHGIKAGVWDRKEDQRSPDVEATFDLVTGKLATTKIEDLFEQRRRFQGLAQGNDRLDFVHLSWDNVNVHVWHAGKPKTVELDQALASYDPKSLQGVVGADGTAWIALKTDPVNAAAVARKKADPEYVDLFKVATDGKATRKARVLAHGVRVRFGVLAPDKVWLVERNTGFERGGKNLTIYQVQ